MVQNTAKNKMFSLTVTENLDYYVWFKSVTLRREDKFSGNIIVWFHQRDTFIYFWFETVNSVLKLVFNLTFKFYYLWYFLLTKLDVFVTAFLMSILQIDFPLSLPILYPFLISQFHLILWHVYYFYSKL